MDELLTAAEVGKILKVGEDFVLRRFGDMPGVVDLGSPEIVRGPRRRRRYRVLRIPRPVLEKFLQSNQIR